MLSYGLLYIDNKLDRKMVDQFRKPKTDIVSQQDINKVYKELVTMMRRIENREPTEIEDQYFHRTAKFIAEDKSKAASQPIRKRYINHLTELWHSDFSFENISDSAKKLSLQYPDHSVCSITGFDESFFQLCIYREGIPLTIHQFGEELTQMGLPVIKGGTDCISSFFRISVQDAEQFLQLTDVMDAEEYIFELLDYPLNKHKKQKKLRLEETE